MKSTINQRSYLFLLPWTLESLGGVNQVVENLMRRMGKDDRYKPILMVNSWDNTKIRKQTIKGFDHYFFRLRNPWNHGRIIINLIMFWITLGFHLKTFFFFLKNKNIAIINVHYCSLYVLNISFLKVLRLFRGKLILSFHGKDLLNALTSKGIERFIWKIILNSADSVITCSEALKNDLIFFNNSCQKKTVAVHNGIDPTLIEKRRDVNYHLAPQFKKQKFILNIGTFEHKKGQDILLRAFKEIAENFSDLLLVLIGRPGDSLDGLKALIRSLELKKRVILCESISHDKIPAFIERSTLFVVPSRYEPFGIVILEAGVYSVPVVASNVGGIPEIISHDKTGRLFQPGNHECLASELEYLLKNSEQRKRLGENLNQHVLKNFSWNRSYQKYMQIADI